MKMTYPLRKRPTYELFTENCCCTLDLSYIFCSRAICTPLLSLCPCLMLFGTIGRLSRLFKTVAYVRYVCVSGEGGLLM